MKTNSNLNAVKPIPVKPILVKPILAASLFAVLGLGAQANAASACKGLENSACNSNASCSWVEGYQRKDGRAVKSFCRTKATAKKSSTAKDASKTASAKKTTKKS